jgi:hypothetical protein
LTRTVVVIGIAPDRTLAEASNYQLQEEAVLDGVDVAIAQG